VKGELIMLEPTCVDPDVLAQAALQSEWDAGIARPAAEVQVTIVATVTVPVDHAGTWLHSDAVSRACAAVGLGLADYEAHEVSKTGAPDPLAPYGS
jgi:hypothetical protein